jgi:D-methionine transport system ATP-binding protein
MMDTHVITTSPAKALSARDRDVSALADALLPVGGEPSGPDRTVVDLTFHGDSTSLPVISRLARTYHVDISILGAAIETLDGRQIGRMRIELPGRFDDNVVPIGYLREQGIQVDVAAEAAS